MHNACAKFLHTVSDSSRIGSADSTSSWVGIRANLQAAAGLLNVIAEGSSGLSGFPCFAGGSSVTILPEYRAELPLRHSWSLANAWENACFNANNLCPLYGRVQGLPDYLRSRSSIDQLFRRARQGRGINVDTSRLCEKSGQWDTSYRSGCSCQ